MWVGVLPFQEPYGKGQDGLGQPDSLLSSLLCGKASPGVVQAPLGVPQIPASLLKPVPGAVHGLILGPASLSSCKGGGKALSLRLKPLPQRPRQATGCKIRVNPARHM